MDGIENVRSVFKAITATRNAASPIQFSQRKAPSEIGMGEMGLKATITGRNPAARRGWPERIACRITKRAETHSTVCNTTFSLVKGSPNTVRRTTVIETHIMIFVSIETSFFCN
jgi:hypothetical protein